MKKIYDKRGVRLENPKHGDHGQHWRVSKWGDPVKFVDNKGKVVLKTPLAGSDYPVEERYCKNCGWIECSGIAGLVIGSVACTKCNEDWD